MEGMLDSPLSPRSQPSGCSSVSSAPDYEQNDGKLERRKTKKKVMYFWNTADVNKWLKKHCGQYHNFYGDLFLQHEISGRTLARLSDSKLQLMGITNSQHREELMRHILRLRLKTEAQEFKTMGEKGLIKDKKTVDSRETTRELNKN